MELEILVKRMSETEPKRFWEICEKAGVSHSTALKIRGGFTKNPGVLTVKALEPFFCEQRKKVA